MADPGPVIVTLKLDLRRAHAPLACVLRGVLKLLGRRYGVRCVSIDVEGDAGAGIRPV